MISAIRRWRVLTIFALAGTLLFSACATKKYVRDQIAGIDPKINEVRSQTRENAERIDAVDKRAQQGVADAAAARTAATAADTRAGQAATAAQTAQTTAASAQQTATTATQGVTTANTRITAVENRFNALNIDRYAAGPVQTVQFSLNSATLDEAGRKTLDGIASQVASLNSGFMIEIQGFASSEGGDDYNLGLSQKRADAAQRYLVAKNVPLFRIAIVGLGAEKAVGDNKTRAGREQNRRVELRVLRMN